MKSLNHIKIYKFVNQKTWPQLISIILQIWQQFSEEIATTNKRLFEKVDERPSWLPKYVGRAIILKMNLFRLTRLKDIFKYAEWLPENSNSLKVYNNNVVNFDF